MNFIFLSVLFLSWHVSLYLQSQLGTLYLYVLNIIHTVLRCRRSRTVFRVLWGETGRESFVINPYYSRQHRVAALITVSCMPRMLGEIFFPPQLGALKLRVFQYYSHRPTLSSQQKSFSVCCGVKRGRRVLFCGVKRGGRVLLLIFLTAGNTGWQP